jgi:hypothetical protein
VSGEIHGHVRTRPMKEPACSMAPNQVGLGPGQLCPRKMRLLLAASTWACLDLQTTFWLRTIFQKTPFRGLQSQSRNASRHVVTSVSHHVHNRRIGNSLRLSTCGIESKMCRESLTRHAWGRGRRHCVVLVGSCQGAVEDHRTESMSGGGEGGASCFWLVLYGEIIYQTCRTALARSTERTLFVCRVISDGRALLDHFVDWTWLITQHRAPVARAH